MAPSNREKESDPVNALRSIAGIANRLEQEISDAIAVARTAVEQSADEVQDIQASALHLIWYKLEKIQEAHAQITTLAPHAKLVQQKFVSRG